MLARLIVSAIAVTAVLAMALPGAAQDIGIRNPDASTPTTLYLHINGFQDIPINTQKPDDRYAASEGLGLQTHSTSCLPPVDGAPLASKEWHTWYGYSSPGYVEYDFEEDGQPRYHPERGLSFDVLLDTGSPFTFYWYLETQTGLPGGSPDPNQAPVVLPDVVVRATVRTGDSITPGDYGYNEGPIVAQGQTEPATLAGAQTQGANYTQVGSRHVYGFAVPMDIQTNKIPRETGYNLRVDVYMDNPACSDDGYIMPNYVRVHTSPDHRPRMELAVTNPVRIEFLHPQFVGDDLVIHTSANSPWGNYDVDETPGGIEIAVDGPSPPQDMQQVAFSQRHHEHNFHQEAVDISYLWSYKEERAADGLYTVDFSVWNDQRTAQATGTAQFEIGKGTVTGCGEATTASEAHAKCETETQPDGAPATKDSPGAGAVALLLALAGAAALVARRRRG